MIIFNRMTIKWKLITVFSIILLIPAILALVLSFFIGQLTLGDLVSTNEIFRLIITFLIFALISIIVFYFLSKYILDPVYKLNEATKEVARGNFTIEMEVKNHDEIGQLTTSFNQMVKELRSIELLREGFISSVSHELKTPVASIKGFSELLMKNVDLSDKSRKYIRIINEESEKVSKLTEMILELNRVENTEIIKKNDRFRLDELIRETILYLERQWSEKSIDFDLNLEQIEVVSNKMVYHLILRNLIENSIKFSYENGLIEISLFVEDNKQKIIIKDYGQGICDEDIDKIFNKFYRGNNTCRFSGNGLGLAIVKKSLELINGEIMVRSCVNKFTEFELKIGVN